MQSVGRVYLALIKTEEKKWKTLSSGPKKPNQNMWWELHEKYDLGDDDDEEVASTKKKPKTKKKKNKKKK